MVILQLTGEQLSTIIRTAVHSVLTEQLNQSAPAPEKPLSVNEAAEFLNLEPATIYGLVHRKEIPCSKPAGSKRLYFSKQELINWLASGRKKTVAEQATDAGNVLRKGLKGKEPDKMEEHLTHSHSQAPLLGDQGKNTKLFHFLQKVPYLTFSDTGLNNIAKRFGLTLDQLKTAIAEYEAMEGLQNG